ncbi:cellulose synthase/poly-beta-1,6-N-acetylglucosamine synthase-like glycosyltransferase [Peribacillus deserti]|uniref:Cellulose synthase/poly-beta-1,6-N-acetylglucosamine synthase-like glycosyltransferase n=1 Tax=Peribacillus deserti TaxID=673318 RepID=A0ABS2QGS5_9BACI|nr:glycosyltransferase family 2 protein [Peribacillus deserti]MBM7691481.1 cellulose synthase/poly-beta-1,6-N-acetylglucosamine synthase-like glycosyltransferase [Peribacillus deserti]
MVSIICCTMRKDYMENVFRNYDSQLWKDKEMIIILNADDLNKHIWEKRAKKSKNVSVYQLSETITLGECLNYGIERAKHDYIAKFDDDDYYAPNYLVHAMPAFRKTNADIIGKRTVYMYFEEEKILAINNPGREKKFVTQGIKGATLIVKKSIFEKVKFQNLNLGEDTVFLRQCIKNNFRIFSGDKTNYVCIRKAKKDHHTWIADNQNLLKKSSFICKTDDYIPYITK